MIISKFKDIFDYLPKSKVKASEGLDAGKYPFYTSSESLVKFCEEPQYLAGSLVFGTGGKASVHYTEQNFSTSTDCIVVYPKQEKAIDAKYVYQYFKGNIRILEDGFKGAGLKHISKAYLSEVAIPHPEQVNDQIRIAHLLGKVEGLIAQRKQHLQQLDDLLKSVFLEMFSPGARDYADWPLVEVKNLAAKHKRAMRTGPFGSNLLHSEFTTEGDVAVLGIDNAVQNRFAWGERRYITKEKYKELESYRVYAGDVIVTIMGTIGRSAVIPDDIPLAINTKHLAAITLNRKIANPLFLSYSIHSNPFILNQFRSKNRGAIMSGLNLGLIKETKIKRPPIDLQNSFATIHIKIDEIKACYQQSLTELEALYGTLSQKAFKGELDLSRINLPTEDIVLNPIEDGRNMSIEMTVDPLTDRLPDPMFSAEQVQSEKGQKEVLTQWLNAYYNQLGDSIFSIENFMCATQERFEQLYPDSEISLNSKNYEDIKKWVFAALNEGRLTQTYDGQSKLIQLKVTQHEITSS